MEVETNCLEVVKRENGSADCSNAAGVVVDEIRMLMRDLNVLQIVHVPREANMAAHVVACFVALGIWTVYLVRG